MWLEIVSPKCNQILESISFGPLVIFIWHLHFQDECKKLAQIKRQICSGSLAKRFDSFSFHILTKKFLNGITDHTDIRKYICICSEDKEFLRFYSLSESVRKASRDVLFFQR